MTDDLGWGDVGFNGNAVVQTPHLDQLASSGIVFNRFYSASAVCSPTRASVLTGRNPVRVGVPTANQGHLREEEITLAELVQEAGYATGHFGNGTWVLLLQVCETPTVGGWATRATSPFQRNMASTCISLRKLKSLPTIPCTSRLRLTL